MSEQDGTASLVRSDALFGIWFDSVPPHPRNPRQHPSKGTPAWDALKKSLDHDYYDPIVWNKRNGMLVSGHLR